MTRYDPSSNDGADASSRRWLPYRWELLGLLWIAFFLHQADRQIYGNLIPLIQADLRLSDEQLGLVASVFTWVYGLMVPLAGYAGDVLRRKWILVISLLVWSAGTLLTGISAGLLGLLLFRSIASGGGEAYYAPSANSLITQFHDKTRALAMSLHQTALYVGIIASFAAGYVGELYGWRSAFFVFGGFGIVWAAVMIWRVEDSGQPGQAASEAASSRPPVADVMREVFLRPTVLMLSLAFAGQVFVNVGYLTWMPTLLDRKFDLSVTYAGLAALSFHHAFAFVGVVLGGRISDVLARRRRIVRMEFEYLGLLLAAPFIYLMGAASQFWLCCLGLSVFGLFRGVYDSNLFAAPFEVIPARLRSSALGVMLSFAFLMGAFAPIVLARLAKNLGLDGAIASLAVVYVASAALVVVAAYTTFQRDAERASGTNNVD